MLNERRRHMTEQGMTQNYRMQLVYSLLRGGHRDIHLRIFNDTFVISSLHHHLRLLGVVLCSVHFTVECQWTIFFLISVLCEHTTTREQIQFLDVFLTHLQPLAHPHYPFRNFLALQNCVCTAFDADDAVDDDDDDDNPMRFLDCWTTIIW